VRRVRAQRSRRDHGLHDDRHVHVQLRSLRRLSIEKIATRTKRRAAVVFDVSLKLVREARWR
jgi:hypothetical protein